ncbi:MAG: glycosyltransferase family 4 protein [Gemmatimonadota bacterium]|nr:glycosyltransferase family 4 protein [Gemmatimonadota bacterium]
MKVGYVVKRYPRYSETFIVNEILAHENAGLELEIFALGVSGDTHFQGNIAAVRAPVLYLSPLIKAVELWTEFEETAAIWPGFWAEVGGEGNDVKEVYQALQLARLAARRGITHLHAHFATSAASVARLAARLAGVPFTMTAHAKDIFHESVDAAAFQAKLIDAAVTVTVSDFNLAFLKSTYGSAAARARRVYNGLDLSAFAYTDPDVRPLDVVAVGRLVEKKGFEDLIEALGILKQRNLPLNCMLIGEGPLEDQIRARIAGLGLGDRVQMAGPCPQREVKARVRSAAVFAAPCVVGADGNRDGLPTVLLEAMALGTPCVSTDVTGIPEILSHRQTGLMVAQREPAGLADALHELVRDRALRIRLARQARRRIEQAFDIHRNAGELRSIFEECRRVGAPAGACHLAEAS